MTDWPVRAARRMSAWSNAMFSAPVRGSDTTSPQQSFADVSRVVLGAQQTVAGSRWRGGLDLDHPPVAIRVCVDQGGLFVESRIDREHGAGDRRHEIGDRLHGLDGAEHLVRAQMRADFRQLHEHDVAQLTLRVVGDANPGGLGAVDANVFVIFRVEQVGRDFGSHQIVTVDARVSASRSSSIQTWATFASRSVSVPTLSMT